MWILRGWANDLRRRKRSAFVFSASASSGAGSQAAGEGTAGRVGALWRQAGREKIRLRVRKAPNLLGQALAAWVLVLGQVHPCLWAEDTVDWAPDGSSGGRARLSGRVLDYTGEVLLLELPDGRQQKIPGEKVLQVHTTYGPVHQEAQHRFEQGRWPEALSLYRKALQEEQRRWVRREILARMTACYEETGQLASACETFLLLMQSDPKTPYWVVVPLAWLPREPEGLLERQARQWLGQDGEQAAWTVLLGASHLLSTSERPAALAQLRRLATHKDCRIALLAVAQTWRTAMQVEPAQLDLWQQTIQKMPESVRAGPYYLLGRAWAQQRQWEEAALAWLRIPILYGSPRALCARALLEAGSALEQLGRPEQSARLYQELLHTHPDSVYASEAAQRIQQLQQAMPSAKP